ALESRRERELEPLRDDVLHAHGLSRTSRDARSDGTRDSSRARVPRRLQRETPFVRVQSARNVLALRRRRLGGRVLGRLPAEPRMTSFQLMRMWSVDPFAIALIALMAIAYAWSIRARKGARPTLFAVAIVFIVLALLSPIAFLAAGLSFSAHMLQHLL